MEMFNRLSPDLVANTQNKHLGDIQTLTLVNVIVTCHENTVSLCICVDYALRFTREFLRLIHCDVL